MKINFLRSKKSEKQKKKFFFSAQFIEIQPETIIFQPSNSELQYNTSIFFQFSYSCLLINFNYNRNLIRNSTKINKICKEKVDFTLKNFGRISILQNEGC